MAKVGFWLRNANGKLAGATIYQQNGETMMREVVSPSNPKTTKQNIQRIIMHTVMQAYSKLKEICDHSFEGQKKGQETMSYFMSQNVQFARQKIADMQAQGVDFYEMYNFVPLGVKGFTPNQYQISMGSLPKVDVDFPSSEEPDTTVVLIPGLASSNVTYGDIINQYSLQRGDQLTFLLIKGVAAGSQAFGQNEFKFCRVILDPTDPETFLPLGLDTPFLDGNGGINAPSIRNENVSAFDIRFNASFNKVVFKSAKAGDVAVAACIIVSRKSGDNWMRSTTYLMYRGGYGLTYSLGDCMDAAANGVSTPIYSPNELYLNNAGQGGGQAAATGEDSQAGGGGTSGGGSSSGGSGSMSGNVTVVTLTTGAGSGSCVAGTKKLIAAASFPAATTINITTDGAPEGAVVSIKASNNASAEDVVSSPLTNGAATLQANLANGTEYFVFYNPTGSDDIATGFSFQLYQYEDGE